MKSGYVKSSPYFFRRIKLSAALLAGVILVLAAVVPAPLQEQADIARVPNPAKSAWFLLWIQELVSYSKYLAYLVLLVTALLLALPWLRGGASSAKATWFPRDQRPVSAAAVAAAVAVFILTVVAMFFRGANWQLVAPF